MTTPTDDLRLAIKLSGKHSEQALTVARKIVHRWYRCQALTFVGRYWPRADFWKLLEEAGATAASQDDPYRQVAVSAWPIRAYLERGMNAPAGRLLEECIRKAANIENLGSRSEALLLIFQAARPFSEDLWRPVFWALVGTTEPVLTWRQSRNLRLAAAMVGRDAPQLVVAALDRLSDQKAVSTIKRDAEQQRHIEPREFFWHH